MTPNIHTEEVVLPDLSLDFQELSQAYPELTKFTQHELTHTRRGQFALTKALFKLWCNVDIEILEGHLVPAMPSRLVYLRIIRRVFDECGLSITKGFDLGTGAYAVYSILGSRIFQWHMIGDDIDLESVKHAQGIIEKNGVKNVEVIEGDGIIVEEDELDFMVCNPPFYESMEAMEKKYEEKEELQREHAIGSSLELVYCGGEVAFVKRLITQSKNKRIKWFSSLLGMKASVQELIDHLLKIKLNNFHVQSYQLGNTKRWILFWSNEHHHPKIYHHREFKNIPITVEEGKFDLVKIQQILRGLKQLEVIPTLKDDEVIKLTIKSSGIVWSRSHRRNPKLSKKHSLQVFVITHDEMHWSYGNLADKGLQSLHGYILRQLKML